MEYVYSYAPVREEKGVTIFSVTAYGQTREFRANGPLPVIEVAERIARELFVEINKVPRETISVSILEKELIHSHRKQVKFFVDKAEEYDTEEGLLEALSEEFGTLLSNPAEMIAVYCAFLHSKGFIPSADFDSLRDFVIANPSLAVEL